MTDGARARMRQIVAECIVKSAHVILTARIYHSSRTLVKRPKCWFNLDIEELDIAQRELEHWRRDPSCPMIIEVFLQPWTARGNIQQVNIQRHDDALPGRRLLERWTMSYTANGAQQSRAPASRLEPSAVYKRMVICMRSLFSYARVLPAYRLYKACAQERGGSMALQYRLTRGAPGALGTGMACPASMEHFAFAPVDTLFGSFRLAVDYAPSSAVTVLKDSTAHAPMAKIIADYAAGEMGSRVAAPLSASMHAPVAGGRMQPHEPATAPAMPSGPLQRPPQPAIRRHSWSLQSPSSPGVPGLGPSGLSMSPPAVMAGASSAASRAAHDTGALRRLSLRSGQSDGEEAASAAPALTHAWSTPPKYPGTPTSPSLPGSSGAVRTWSRAAANQDAFARMQQAASSRQTLEPRARPRPSPGSSRLQATEESAASNGARQTSAPVSIPGASDAGARHSRIHSSGDLAAMQQQETTTQVRTVKWMSGHSRVPASAPAASAALGTGPGSGQEMERPSARTTGFIPAPSPRMALGSPIGSQGQPGPSRSCLKRPDGSSAPEERRLSFASGSNQSAAQQPPTPPALYAMHTLGSDSSGSAASSFPASCSPHLPFAFTPSGLSFSSAHDPAAQAAAANAAASHGEGAQASPPAHSHALTLFRRPALGASPRLSSAFEMPPVVGALGYSLSPVQLPPPASAPSPTKQGHAHTSCLSQMQGSLESSLLSASTPRHTAALPLKLPSPFPPSSQRGIPNSGTSFTAGSGPPLLTYPGSGQPGSSEHAEHPPSHSATEDAEGELLPFALDGDAMPASPQSLAALRARGGYGLSPSDPDDAVGAFVRVLQGAPVDLHQGEEQGQTLGGPGRMTLEGGLAQLSALKAQLEAM